jgi:hypothetical protein
MSDPTDPRLHLAWVEKNRKKEKERRKALKRAPKPREAVEAPRGSPVKLPKTRRDFMKALYHGYRMGWADAMVSLRRRGRKPDDQG